MFKVKMIGALVVVCVFALTGALAKPSSEPVDNNVVEDSKRIQKSVSVADLLACGWDAPCFVERADNLLVVRRDMLLAQADNEAFQITGRADSESAPSAISSSIANIITELTEIFKGGIAGLFRDGKDDDDEEAVEEEEDEDDKTDDEDDGTNRNINGDGRGKKKKKKKAIIKLILLGLLLKAKLTMLLKVLAAHLQVKFFLIALAGLILNAARFYLDIKKAHHPQKVIYYEHAQHQHHYDHDDHEEWSGGGGHGGSGGSYWGRAYDTEEQKTAQDLAYAKQKAVNNRWSASNLS